MPKGILTRLIVELHEFIEAQTLVWKTGVVFTNGSARAEVTEHYSKRELRLRVSGGDPKRWLSAVTHEIDKIHASYQSSDNPRDTRLRYQTLIPCNCDTCKGSQTPHDYPYDRLQKFLRDGQYQIQCQESYAMVDVRRLLDDVLYRTREPDAKGMGCNGIRFAPPRSACVRHQPRPRHRSKSNIGQKTICWIKSFCPTAGATTTSPSSRPSSRSARPKTSPW
jgi:hypothetical protein